MPFPTRKQTNVAPVADTSAAPKSAPGVTETRSEDAQLGRHVRAFDDPGAVGETRRGHSRRMARRTRLHGYAFLAVALFAFLIALAAANTASVKVSWLFGGSRLPLVWLVLAAAILGWLLGLMTNAALQRRTRGPRPALRP
jgi:uncharacterized integral membrane protein